MADAIWNDRYILTVSNQDTMYTSALEYDSNERISGYAGSAFAAGTDIDFGYTDTDTISSINTSALTDVSLNNIVQTNSASWGGSALPISAGPGIDIQLANDTLVFMSTSNETVLYSNLTGRPDYPGQSITLSESPLNFNYIGIYLNGSSPTGTENVANGYEEVPHEQMSSCNSLQFIKGFCAGIGERTNVYEMGCGYSGTSGLTWTKWYGYAKDVAIQSVDFDNETHLNIWKVVGINRIAGGN